MKIVFIGTPEFSANILKTIIDGGRKPALVVTETDKPTGRKQVITPPPVKLLTQEHNIPVEQPVKIEDCKLKIKNRFSRSRIPAPRTGLCIPGLISAGGCR